MANANNKDKLPNSDKFDELSDCDICGNTREKIIPYICNDHTDLVLIVEGKPIHVSKGILCGNSRKFQIMVNRIVNEQKSNEIHLRRACYTEMCALMEVIHPPIRPNTIGGTTCNDYCMNTCLYINWMNIRHKR